MIITRTTTKVLMSLEGTSTNVLLSLEGGIVSELAKPNMIFKKDKNKKGKTQGQRKR